MSDSAAEEPNEWAGDRSERWVRMWQALDRQLAPVTDLLFTSLALEPGERVLDVGCGTGPTTRMAAALVGPSGSVTGVDISAEMLDTARAVAVDTGSAPIEWVQADASHWDPAGAPYDVIMSRFGVMFFGDPTAAFANLLRLAAPGGRLRVAAWADRTRSPLFELPLSVALDHRRQWGLATEVPPTDGGPFSLGDGVIVRRLLEGCGWRDVSVEPRPLRLAVGGGAPPAEAARASLEFGPTRIVAEDLDEIQRGLISDAIAELYQHNVDEHGNVLLEATPVLIEARSPT